MILTLLIILILISGISKAMMDTLQFHFYTSVFKDKGLWFSPDHSWRNKYEWFKNSKVLTWLISNPFVFLTDAWHCCQLIYSVSFAAAFVVSGIFFPIWVAFLVYINSRLVFHIFYTYIFNKNK